MILLEKVSQNILLEKVLQKYTFGKSILLTVMKTYSPICLDQILIVNKNNHNCYEYLMKKLNIFSLNYLNQKTMKKPSNAFQHYLKHWKNLSDEEKKPFLELEKRDKLIYAAEKRILEKKQEEEIKKLKMYIQITTSHVRCVGLDNGFKCFTIRGPIVRVVEFTDKELVDLEKK
jgi:hypothetical protein